MKRIRKNDMYNYDLIIHNNKPPTNIDDETKGCDVGTHWKDYSSNTVYKCINSTKDFAVWVLVYGNSANAPYVTTSTVFTMLPNTTQDIEIEGNNFDTGAIIDFGPEIRVNFLNITSTKITANVTSSNYLQQPYSIVVTVNGMVNNGSNPTIEITNTITGTGQAGLFVTDFNNGGEGNSLWGNDWILEVTGSITDIDSYFRSSVNGTPSSGTGVLSNNQFGVGTNSYMFTECSGVNAGVGQQGIATTTNFKEFQSISFQVHYFGTDLGTCKLQGQSVDGSWFDVWSINSNTCNSQGDNATTISLPLSLFLSSPKALRFVFNEGNNAWSSDVCIDNVEITSV